MKGFGFLTKLVLFFLLAGIATTLFESSFLGSVQEPLAVNSREDSPFSFETDLGTITLHSIHSVIRCFCPGSACAGDLEGDVQGD